MTARSSRHASITNWQEAQGDDGVRHGLLSRAFVTEVGRIEAGELQSVSWARVSWQKLSRERGDAATRCSIYGCRGTSPRDPRRPAGGWRCGLRRQKTGPNEYAIDAGTLADVSEGAKLAVYEDTPKLFPMLGTPEDLKARVDKSLLVVQQADRATRSPDAKRSRSSSPPGLRQARGGRAGSEAPLRRRASRRHDRLPS